jgi:hypothetical protein
VLQEQGGPTYKEFNRVIYLVTLHHFLSSELHQVKSETSANPNHIYIHSRGSLDANVSRSPIQETLLSEREGSN